MQHIVKPFLFKLRQLFIRMVLKFFPSIFFNISKLIINQKSNPDKFRESGKILFIGHDANRAGAQILLLNLLKWIKQNTCLSIKIILIGGGPLLEQFKQIGPTLVWEDFRSHYPDFLRRNRTLREFLTNIDLIYGNSVLSSGIYDELEFLQAPYISHIHELEKSIRAYTSKRTLNLMKRYTTGFIACSPPVSLNLQLNHKVDEKNIITIFEYIENKQIEFNKSQKEYRKTLGLIEDGFLVFGCGTIYWRKGSDIFIETVLNLRNRGLKNFHFYWIGENMWDKDPVSSKICDWSDLEKKIMDNGLSNFITFLGEKENVTEYFMAGDLFYLPSREDPFPLVCLEAAQCQLPVICFEEAGGMADFVAKDAGFVVPFGNVDAVVEKILHLFQNRKFLIEMGLIAGRKVLENYTVDVAAPQLLNYCSNIYVRHFKF